MKLVFIEHLLALALVLYFLLHKLVNRHDYSMKWMLSPFVLMRKLRL